MPDELLDLDAAIAKATTDVESGAVVDDSQAGVQEPQQPASPEPAPQEPAKEPAEAPKDPQVSPEAKPGEAKEAAPKSDLTFEAPASWRKEAKEQWNALPLPVKAEIAKRERENLSALKDVEQKLASREKDSGELGKVLAPFEQDWGARGIRTSEAIAQTLSRAKYAYANPEKFIREFAAETGVNLNFSQTGPDDGTYQDPQLAALQAKIAGFEQQFTQQQQTAQQAQLQAKQQAVQAFENAKDEAGNLKFPHHEKVRDLMAGVLPRIAATEPNLNYGEQLAKAYEMACRAHPEVWQQMREDLLVQSQSSQVQQQAQAAQKAKGFAVSPASSPVGGNGGDVSMRGKSLDDVINHVMSQGQGRV